MDSPQSCCPEEPEDRHESHYSYRTIKGKSRKCESQRMRETSPVCSHYSNIWLSAGWFRSKINIKQPRDKNSVEIWAATHHWGDEFYSLISLCLKKKSIFLGRASQIPDFLQYAIHDVKDTMQSYSTHRE